jgi:hypothetical protein
MSANGFEKAGGTLVSLNQVYARTFAHEVHIVGKPTISPILAHDAMIDLWLTPIDTRGIKKLAKIPLVKNDRLFLVTEASCESIGDDDLQNAVATFQKSFDSIWHRIPVQDRHQILQHWRSPSALDVELPTRPLIQLLDVGPWDPSYVGVDRFGNALTFPIALAAFHPSALPLVIARNLVHVYRYATGDFWRLYGKLVENPLTAWEQQQSDEVTHAALDKKHSALERSYLRRHKTKVAAVLRKWEIEARRLD